MMQSDHHKSRSDLGFSLLEVLITVFVLSILATASVLLLRPPSAPLLLGTAVRELCADMRLAQSQAMASSRETIVRINTTERTYEGPRGLRQLPAAANVTVTFAASERSARSEGLFRFYPSGRSTGGDVKFALEAASARVSINWLTGQAQCEF